MVASCVSVPSVLLNEPFVSTIVLSLCLSAYLSLLSSEIVDVSSLRLSLVSLEPVIFPSQRVIYFMLLFGHHCNYSVWRCLRAAPFRNVCSMFLE